MNHSEYQQMLTSKLSSDKDYQRKKKRSERLLTARAKGTHTLLEWEQMKQFFGHECVRCEGENNLLHQVKDHIIPLYQGGSDSIRNLQPLCAKCNCSKGPESTDWRIVFCEKHGLDMPKEWMPL